MYGGLEMIIPSHSLIYNYISKRYNHPNLLKGVIFFMGNVQCKIGDVVRVNGRDYVIAEITYQDFWERGADDDGWMIEFIDNKGDYHYWKQYLDGGELIRK